MNRIDQIKNTNYILNQRIKLNIHINKDKIRHHKVNNPLNKAS